MPKLSVQEREQRIRESIRKRFRDGYVKYPMTLYNELKQQQSGDSIYSTPASKARTEVRRAKWREEAKAGRLEFEAQEAQAIREFQDKHPEIVEEIANCRKERDEMGELVKRVYDEEVERLKTLPVVKKNPIKELIEAVQFRFYVVRRFGFRYKGKSVKIGPEDYARSPDRN